MIKQLFPFKHIRTKLIIYYSFLVAVVIILIGSYIYVKAKNFVEQQIEIDFIEKIARISDIMDDLYTKMDKLSKDIISDPVLIEVLKKNSSIIEPREQIRDYASVRESLLNVSANTSTVSGISIFSEDGRSFNLGLRSIATGYDFRKEQWYQDLNERNNYLTGVHIQENIVSEIRNPVISYSKKIIDKETYKNLGYVLVDYDLTYLNDQLRRYMTYPNSFTYIIYDNELLFTVEPKIGHRYRDIEIQYDDINYLIESKKGKNVYSNGYTTLSGVDFFYSYHQSLNTDLQILSIVPKCMIFKRIDHIRYFTFFIVLVGIFLTFLLSIGVSHNITMPLIDLVDKMNSVENGHTDVKVEIHSSDEVGMLADTFNKMIIKINEIIKELVEAEHEKNRAEIQALQAQINPHFLHNTLSIIDSIATINGEEEIAEITRVLSKLFRYNITSDQLTTIGQEIEQIQLYLYIEKKRYYNRIDYLITVEEKLRQVKILKLLIQPIVENTIIHCLENEGGKVYLYISVRKSSKNTVEIKIRDTGKGIKPTRLKKIQESLEKSNHVSLEEDGSKGHHVGLKNVNNRIRKYYGKQYGLRLSSKFGEGTVGIITIPINTLLD